MGKFLNITEIIPDDMPDWADEAMERGQLFQEMVGRMDAVTQENDKLQAQLAEEMRTTDTLNKAWTIALRHGDRARAQLEAVRNLTRYEWDDCLEDYVPFNNGKCVSYEKLQAAIGEKS